MNLRAFLFSSSVSILLLTKPASAHLSDYPLLKDISIRVKRGECITALKFEKERTYRLGSGAGGGNVYRVVRPGARAFIEKHYYYDSLLTDDVRALNLLDAALKEDGKIDDIKVVRVKSIESETVLRFHDVRGEVLDDVYKGLPRPAKKELRDYFIAQLKRIEGAIQRFVEKNPAYSVDRPFAIKDYMPLGPTHYDDGPELPALALIPTLSGQMKFTDPSGRERYFGIWIKSDNVLIDRYGNLVIFDPF